MSVGIWAFSGAGWFHENCTTPFRSERGMEWSGQKARTITKMRRIPKESPHSHGALAHNAASRVTCRQGGNFLARDVIEVALNRMLQATGGHGKANGLR